MPERTALLSRTEARLAERDQTAEALLARRVNVLPVNLSTTAPTGSGMQVFWNVRQGKAVGNAYGLAPIAADCA